MEVRQGRELWIDIAGLVALLIVVAGIVLRWQKAYEKYAVYLLAVGILGLLLYFLYQAPVWYRTIQNLRLIWLQQVVYIILILGILGLVNFLGYRHNFTYDTTKEKRHTLSSETVKIVREIREPVRVLGFFGEGESDREPKREFEDLISKYTALSPKIQYEHINYTLKPSVAKQYDVTMGGTVVLQRGDRKVRITNLTEDALTNGLVELTESPLEVCFITGHKEKSIDSFEEDGYGDISRLLAQKGFTTRSLVLAQVGKVPDDCAVAVLPGPKNPLLPKEWEAIGSRLEERGSVFLLLDPFTDRKGNEVLAHYGVRIGEELVIDPESILRTLFQQTQAAIFPILQGEDSYDTQFEVVKEMIDEITIFPIASPIWFTSPAPEGLTSFSFLKTSASSWAETDLVTETVKFDEGKDARGPLNLSVAVEKDGKRLIVLGDSDFATNAHTKNLPGNATLFLNSIRWLAKREKYISIPAKQEETQLLNMPMGHARQVVLIFLFLIPILFLFWGITMWWVRRKL